MKLSLLPGGARIGLSAGMLRGISMLLRFPALVWMASSLEVTTFAHFIVMQTTVILFSFLVGLELHQVAVRSYVQSGDQHATAIETRHRKNGMAVAILASVILLSSLIFVNEWSIVECSLVIFIALVEYRQTESGRYLIAEGRNTAAMALSLLRQAAWMPVACGALILFPSGGLLLILSIWSVASLLSEVADRFLRQSAGMFAPERKTPTNIIQDIPFAFPFYLVVVSVMIREQFDKILVKNLAGDEEVAAYGFFATLAGLSLAIIQTMVIAENARRILKGAQTSVREVRKLVQTNMLVSIGMAAGIAVLVWFASVPLLKLMGRDLYLEKQAVLAILLVSTIAQAANSTQTLALTALHQERKLAALEIGSATLSLGLNLLLIPRFGALSAAAVLGGTALMAAAAKSHLLARLAHKGSPVPASMSWRRDDDKGPGGTADK